MYNNCKGDEIMSNSVMRDKAKEFAKNIVFLCRNMKAEHKELEIAQKECYETEYWLELLFETGYIEQTSYKAIQNDCGAIRRMLIASINTIEAKQE